MMRKAFAVVVPLALICLSGLAHADVFNLGPGLTSLETVTVGDPGNVGYSTYNRGAVDYVYGIGKYEVTAGQYTDFLSHKAKTDEHGLYNTQMASDPEGCGIQRTGSGTTLDPFVYSVAADLANRPVNYVSFWDACRFANWLHNGQGSGDTETGAYILDGYNGRDGYTIERNAGWRWSLTSEDEWFKAAYYKGDGTNTGYWEYPTQNDSVPSNVLGEPADPGNNATFYDNAYTIGSPYYRTEAGAHEYSESAYGTFDQGGNVFEWNEAVVYRGYGYTERGTRGGCYSMSSTGLRRIIISSALYPDSEGAITGFRVSQAVPEPGGLVALGTGLTGLMGLVLRRRRAI